MDSGSEVITKLDTTPGNTHGGREFPMVIEAEYRERGGIKTRAVARYERGID